MSRFVWPLLGQEPLFPDEPGRFGTVRKSDVHTGVDLYTGMEQPVVAVEDGEVVLVEAFTGAHVVKEADRSPWWNNTWAILVEGRSGVITYGEVRPYVAIGERVIAGQVIGHVIPVLRTFKGRPMVMLHLELMRPGTRETLWWKSDEPRPAALLDPTPMLARAAGGIQPIFDLDFYDGIRFRDPSAKVSISYEYGSRLNRP